MSRAKVHSDRNSLLNDRLPSIGNTPSHVRNRHGRNRDASFCTRAQERPARMLLYTYVYVRYQNTLMESTIALVIEIQAATFH